MVMQRDVPGALVLYPSLANQAVLTHRPGFIWPILGLTKTSSLLRGTRDRSEDSIPSSAPGIRGFPPQKETNLKGPTSIPPQAQKQRRAEGGAPPFHPSILGSYPTGHTPLQDAPWRYGTAC